MWDVPEATDVVGIASIQMDSPKTTASTVKRRLTKRRGAWVVRMRSPFYLSVDLQQT
jgi:hypothetical protein